MLLILTKMEQYVYPTQFYTNTFSNAPALFTVMVDEIYDDIVNWPFNPKCPLRLF